MKIEHGLDGLRGLAAGSVLTIGNFDGIHLGHAEILRTARRLRAQEASLLRSAALPRGMHAPEAGLDAPAGEPGIVAVTFEPHPLTVLRPELAPARLTPIEIKERLLAEGGVDRLVILPPTPEVLNLAAEDFWRIVRDEVRPSHLVEGGSFTFGKGRRGTIERLREWAGESEIELHVVEGVSVPLIDLRVAPVSSSLIRWLLLRGRVRDAAICLGRAYEICGVVERGEGRGHGLGFPTANVRMGGQLIPADGVYAGRCAVGGRVYPAAVSIGTNPTFEGEGRTVEAHLIGFEGDLYGRELRVGLVDWLREQRRFTGVAALGAQIGRDVGEARLLEGMDPARPIAGAAPGAVERWSSRWGGCAESGGAVEQ